MTFIYPKATNMNKSILQYRLISFNCIKYRQCFCGRFIKLLNVFIRLSFNNKHFCMLSLDFFYCHLISKSAHSRCLPSSFSNMQFIIKCLISSNLANYVSWKMAVHLKNWPWSCLFRSSSWCFRFFIHSCLFIMILTQHENSQTNWCLSIVTHLHALQSINWWIYLLVFFSWQFPFLSSCIFWWQSSVPPRY